MSDDTFDAAWLALREPVDHRSRHGALAMRVAEAGMVYGWTRVLDLGGGTGSNLRYLSPRLPWARVWEVVDHDPELLRRIEAPQHTELECTTGDLRLEGIAASRRADLVSASALLDLVSRSWLETLTETLATALAERPVGVLFTLSYDGSVQWTDGDPDDGFALAAVNRHQQRQKGLGAALGPDAAPVARDLLESIGLECAITPAPWILRGARDAPLALRLLDGWATAAKEVEPDATDRLDAWRERRTATIRSGSYDLRVGHHDLLGLPRP